MDGGTVSSNAWNESIIPMGSSLKNWWEERSEVGLQWKSRASVFIISTFSIECSALYKASQNIQSHYLKLLSIMYF